MKPRTKKALLLLAGLALVALMALVVSRAFGAGGARAQADIETATIRRGDLAITVEAAGTIRANQTAQLVWQSSGVVGQINVARGQQVEREQALAELRQDSLPQAVLLAQYNLISARAALDDLLHSKSGPAEAQKAVDDARQALEDARHPALAQARAFQTLAAAQKAVDLAHQIYVSQATPIPQEAIDQAYANLVLAENALNNTRQIYDRIQRRMQKPPSSYRPWESRSLYAKILRGLELKLANDQLAYERQVEKYNRLRQPRDPLDVAVAEGNLAKADAELAQAQREWERAMRGASPGEIAVLEAQLADAQRRAERLEDGPDPREVAAAEARVDAAEAAIQAAAIAAPFAGTITEIYHQPGDVVAAGAAAFRLDDLSRLVVEVGVSEIDINRFQPGQAARLVLEAAPGREYHGQVIAVPAVGESLLGGVIFNVQVEINDGDDWVRPGMSCTATFVVNEIDGAVLIPNQAIHYRDGQRVVYVLRDGRQIPVEVELGQASTEYAQLLAGDVQPGDQVILNPEE